MVCTSPTDVPSAETGARVMTSAQPAASTDQRFSEVVRSATSADHERAAVSSFMTALFQRELPRAAYVEMVAQHYFAYVVLEDAADAVAGDATAGPFVDEALRRVPSLRADMSALVGADWADRFRPSEATRAYCDRMAEVCTDAPERLVAHHYTRYMGDLSGGQMIGQIAREAYGLSDGAGAAFYRFDQIAEPSAYKDRYRRRLDEAQWSDHERAALLEEVRVAYRLNTEVFDELDRQLAAGAFG
jgi:heme oxygenase